MGASLYLKIKGYIHGIEEHITDQDKIKEAEVCREGGPGGILE
jgi:hypothetical protein